MADQSTLAGLLGMDPEQLQNLLSALGPTPEMQAQAHRDKWIATGLGILGAQPGNTWRAIGQGGLLGMQAGQQSLKDQLAQRGVDLQQVLALRNAAQQARMQNLGMSFFGGGSAPMAQGGPPQASPGGAIGAQNPSVAGAAGPITPPVAPLSGQGAPVPGVPSWANPAAQLGSAIASGDWKKVSDVVGEQMKLQIGPDGSLFRNGIPVGRMTPQGAIIYQDGDISRPKFYANPAEADAAAAKAAGAIAAEQKKSEIITAPVPGTNRTQMGYAGNLLPPLPGATPAAGGLPPGTDLHLQGPLSAQDMQAQLAAIQGQGAGAGGGLTGPDPIAMKAAEANATTMASVYAKQHEKVDADAEAAGTLRARLAQMNELLSQFSPNMAAPARQKVAEVAQAMGMPDNIVSGLAAGDLASMQEFRKHSVQMAFEAARTQMGGVPRAWMELKTQLEANPSASLTPQANQAIMAFMDGMAKRAETKQVERDRWLVSHPDLKGFEGSFAREFPASQFLPDPKQFNVPSAPATASSNGWTVKQIR